MSLKKTKDHRTQKQDQIRSEVYDTLAQIAFEHDADKEDLDIVLKWFNDKFYEDDESHS